MLPKIIVILGPNASGKSDLAVEIARRFNGEVVSADSRQVYRGLDIGSGKITKREMRGIPHHLLDVANPSQQFPITKYQRLAKKAITNIIKRSKVPIICGGTGYYIQSIVDNTSFPPVPPNNTLRKELSTKSAQKLFKILIKLDPRRAQEIDAKNPARLIRAIEIATALGSVPNMEVRPPYYEVLEIGLTLPVDILKEKIKIRLKRRLRKGIIAEARRLHQKGLSWKRMRALGLEYRALADFLTGTISRAEMEYRLILEITQYAKRQMTWFKRDKRIMWFAPSQITIPPQKLLNKALLQAIKKFLITYTIPN